MHVALFLAVIFICLSFGISALLWFKNQQLEKDKQTELLALARQVSHDLRSPLSALNHISAGAAGLTPEESLILRNVANRINDIANSLTRKGQRETTQAGSISILMLSAVADSIVSEVRIRLRDRMQIEIQAHLDQSYGLFSEADEGSLKLSILEFINNAVDVMGNTAGKILVSVGSSGEENQIEVAISQGQGVASSFSWKFTKAPPPVWFLPELKILPQSFFISVDDDQTIHQIWAQRLAGLACDKAGIRHLVFSSLREFETWYFEFKESFTAQGAMQVPPLLIMMDQEFTGQNLTGLDLVEKLNIAPMSVLVSSRVEDSDVQARAVRFSIRMVPKLFAAWLPLSVGDEAGQLDALVIDDDPLVHMTWKMTAAAKGRRVQCFSDFESFVLVQQSFPRGIPIYIDVTLANFVRGEQVAEKVSEMGFTKICLATGHNPAEIQAPSCVSEIVGKVPRF